MLSGLDHLYKVTSLRVVSSLICKHCQEEPSKKVPVLFSDPLDTMYAFIYWAFYCL